MKKCVDCGKKISPTATRCRECNKNSPVIRKKILEKNRNPVDRAKRSESLRKTHAKRIKKKQLSADISYNKNGPIERERGKYIVENRGIYNTSKLETKIIKMINELGVECKQSYMPREINYIFDAYLPEHRTLIEVDGKYWHGKEMQEKNGVKDSEKKKTALARAAEYRLIRFKEEKLPKDVSKLTTYIKGRLKRNGINIK